MSKNVGELQLRLVSRDGEGEKYMALSYEHCFKNKGRMDAEQKILVGMLQKTLSEFAAGMEDREKNAG